MKKKKIKNKKKNFKKTKKYYYKTDIFISRMASILKIPHKKTKELFYQRIVSVIRLNDLLDDPQKIFKVLEEKNLDLKEVPWSKHTYIVKNKDKSELSKMQEYAKSLFYIQNLSSQLPPIILNPSPEDTILDMCAAPGSKTTQLASLMNNKGLIIANDDNYKRVHKMSKVLEKFGVKNTQINFAGGEELDAQFENYFDKVLLDAPCSGEGMIYLGAPKPLRFWSIKRTKEMSKIQKELIKSAFRCLKPGGEMVYATCTLSPNENESVVTHLMHEFKQAQLEEIELIKQDSFKEYKPFVKRGLKEWNEEFFHPDIDKTMRIIPGKTMMGFYIALIKKV